MTKTAEILHIGRIQFWQNGIMIGFVSHIEAIKMVDSGMYRIINSQTIDWTGVMIDNME